MCDKHSHSVLSVGKPTHEISEQVDIVFLDPVAEDFSRSVSLGEDELYQPGGLLLGRRLSLETAELLCGCRFYLGGGAS